MQKTVRDAIDNDPFFKASMGSCNEANTKDYCNVYIKMPWKESMSVWCYWKKRKGENITTEVMSLKSVKQKDFLCMLTKRKEKLSGWMWPRSKSVAKMGHWWWADGIQLVLILAQQEDVGRMPALKSF